MKLVLESTIELLWNFIELSISLIGIRKILLEEGHIRAS